MKQSIIRNLSLYTRTRQPSFTTTQLALSTRPRLSFYSTEYQSRNPEVSKDEEDGVSNEELKNGLDEYFKGDKARTTFEAIMKQKLTGKHEQTDEQLMEGLCGKRQGSLSDYKEEESDYDEVMGSVFDECYTREEKAADLSKAMDMWKKKMPATKRENW